MTEQEATKPHITATRATLAEQWHQSRCRLDWMHVPNAPNWINKLVSCKDLPDGHWAQYACESHVRPLLERRCKQDPLTRGLSMVSLGCGSAHIEETLIGSFAWPIAELKGLEYDDALRDDAAKRFARFTHICSNFDFFDFNSHTCTGQQYDIVFSCHAIHHATDLEFFLSTINSLLKPDGLFIGIDFFGPTRFQIEPEVRAIIDNLYAILPENLKYDLRLPEPQRPPVAFAYPTIAEVRNADISESVRSSDLRTLLFANFPIVEIKPMGGTILRWLLQYRAGNFDHSKQEHVAISDLLFYIEKMLIEQRVVRSDDLFFVLKKSDSIPEHVINPQPTQ